MSNQPKTQTDDARKDDQPLNDIPQRKPEAADPETKHIKDEGEPLGANFA